MAFGGGGAFLSVVQDGLWATDLQDEAEAPRVVLMFCLIRSEPRYGAGFQREDAEPQVRHARVETAAQTGGDALQGEGGLSANLVRAALPQSPKYYGHRFVSKIGLKSWGVHRTCARVCVCVCVRVCVCANNAAMFNTKERMRIVLG